MSRGERNEPSGLAVPNVIQVADLYKTYGEGEAIVRALDGVTLTVERGEYVAIMGSSGSGKSTLMHILGCLDVPTSGTYHLDGVDVSRLNDRQLALVRNRRIGFVFQAFNLIPRTSALANVELPLAYAGIRPGVRRKRALAALDLVGLANRADHDPNQLSGGQQQRVAVARALVSEPALLLADEPTGNLDSKSTTDVLGVLDELNRQGRTIVLITHEDEVAHHAKRVIRLRDGQILSDVRQDPRTFPETSHSYVDDGAGFPETALARGVTERSEGAPQGAPEIAGSHARHVEPARHAHVELGNGDEARTWG